MNKLTLALLALCISVNTMANDTYNYSLNLRNVVKDRVTVTLNCPSITTETILFNFPSTVPGTYATLNYGNYIQNLIAYDASGNTLKVSKQGKNSYVISNAKSVSKITYVVNDSWDSGIKKYKIFEPAGTNIEAGKNFVLNNAGFFGYFEGMELRPITINLSTPTNLIGITSLEGNTKAPGEIVYKARSYHQLMDCPIFVCKPDTAVFKVGNTTITVGVINENGSAGAQKILTEVKESILAAEQFLGELPVKNYNFLVYVRDFSKYKDVVAGKGGIFKKLRAFKALKGQAFGALEHPTSSLYFMPDFGGEEYIKSMKDVCIHEFLHIVTPLNLHSQHIGNFSYSNPKMSKHLWLYEGITEYFAGLIQMKGNIYTPEKYFERMKGKMEEADLFPTTMTFTQMSENVLVKPYKDQYPQVYERGAVLGMLLDIEIIRLTEGKKTLRDVVLTLSKKYGPEKSFDEATFITEFVAQVNPQLIEFFDNCVAGSQPLQYEKLFNVIGVDYAKEKKVMGIKHPVLGNDVTYKYKNIKGGIYIIKKVGEKEYAGLKKGDIVIETLVERLMAKDAKDGEEVEMDIIRNNKKTLIKFKTSLGESTLKNYVKIMENKTQLQKTYFERFTTNRKTVVIPAN
jgi:predicted metalloprotease with PDZ domain